jgi:hypothetical protein
VAIKKRGGELTTVPVSCPKCGQEGYIRIERLNRGFSCKQCRTKFFVDISGTRAVNSDTAMEKTKESQAKENGHKSGDKMAYTLPDIPHYGRHDRAVGNLVSAGFVRMRKLPRAAKMVLITLPLILVLGGYAGYLALESRAEAPKDLQSRARIVGEAFGRDDIGTIEDYAASGTTRDVRRWLDKARPVSWGERVEPTVFIRVAVSVVNQGEKEARLIVSVAAPRGSKAAKPAPAAKQAKGNATKTAQPTTSPGLELMTFWILEGEDWNLEGTKTLNATSVRGTN